MPTAVPARRVPWHTLVVVLLTGGLIWIFVRSINLREAWTAVLDAHPGWIALAILVTLQTYVIRAFRWQVLLRPIGKARFRTAFRTTVIGFAATFLLPARVGEVLRPYLLARAEHLNPASAFATIVVERLLDLCAVLVLFAISLLTVTVEISRDVKIAGLVAAAAGVGGLAVLFVLAGHPERLGRLADVVTRRLPARFASTIGQLVRMFADGLKVMRNPMHLAVAMFWSGLLWLSISLGIMLTSWAFDLTISFVDAFLVDGYLTVGVTAPTPGATGGFHLAYKLAMTLLRPGADFAPRIVAAAIVLHLVSFVPVTIGGLFFMWQDGLTLGRLKGMGAEARAADGVPAKRVQAAAEGINA